MKEGRKRLHFVSGALIVEKVYLLPLCILILKNTRSAIAMTATAKQLPGEHQGPREIFVSGALIVKKVCLLLLYPVTSKNTGSAIAMMATAKQLLGGHQGPREKFG